MKKLLLSILLFITVNAYGQQPTPLMNTYISGISATRIIDNRPANTRRSTYVSIACSGTGTWQAALAYSSTGTGSWTSYGSSGIVDQDSTSPIAFGFKLVYPNYVRVLITGTATCSYSGFQNLFPGGGSSTGAGTLTSVTVAGTASQITATGTCTSTTVVTCTFSIPSAFVLPGTINGLTLTTSTGTFTLTNGKTFSVLKTLTFDGTDGVTITFPASSATVATLGLTNTFTGRQDATGAASTAPAKTGTSLPATCIVGDQYFKSDATAGSNLYGCTSINTWTLQSGGGGGISGLTTGCIPKASSSTTLSDSIICESGGVATVTGTLAATGGIAAGSSPPSLTAGTGGVWAGAEGTVPSVCAATSVGCLYMDSTQHGLLASFNNGSYLPVPRAPASTTSGNLASFNAANGGLLADSGVAAADVVTLTASQALTNKELTSPVITSPTGLPSTTCTAPTIITALSSALAGTCTAPILTQNSQSAAYTTVLGDAGKSLYHPSADTTARTWTIDSNANVAYVVGTCITFINDTSAGVLTIAITSDTMILAGAGTTGSRTLAANGIATACKMTSTRWIINGSGLT